MIVLKICDILFVNIIIFDIMLFIVTAFKSRSNHNYPIKESISNPKFAVLIPARDESKVIEGLIKSIKDQTFNINMNDVYVIVEDINDYTCDIVKKYGATTIVRKNLELRRKGYALDEAVKFILDSGKKYDAYFIFDADNVLDKDYFRNMNETFFNGYDIGIGYRNTKNGNDNIVANPDLANDPTIASYLTLGWFLTTSNGKRAIAAANAGDIKACTKAINGGFNGLADRIKKTAAIASAMGVNVNLPQA